MALTLKEIQARLLEQQAKKDRVKNGGGFTGDNAVYPFWNNPEGSTAILRFLPDGDPANDFFWLERLIIKLPFPGVKGAADARPVEVQVPCTDMWKPKTCPITAEISPWWKDPALEDLARTYYRKKSFLFQGFVPENPNKDDQTPENPIRRFIINPSVFEIVKSVLLDKDLENNPTDYSHGLDFYLTKTKKGKWADYTSSKWARKERALDSDEAAAIQAHGLWSLNSFLPKKPDDAHLTAIMELFKASVDQELYDTDRWGQFYRPNGMRTDSYSNANNATAPASTESVDEVVETVITPVTPVSKVTETVAPTEKKQQTPDEIIAAIRQRQSGKK